MKQITALKWLKMNHHQKSWIVHRSKGGIAHVYWHCVDPDGKKHGGSMTSKSRCDAMIETAKSLTKKEAAKIPCPFPHPFASCVAKPCTAFPHYSEHEHIALGLIPDIVAKHGRIQVMADGLEVIVSAGGLRVVTWGYEQSLCLLHLALCGVVAKDGTTVF